MRQIGKFITMEGGDGTGKTTQAKLLYTSLKNTGIITNLTREPGGTKGAEEIREILVKGKISKWDNITETLLYFAARRDHMIKLLKPSLDAEKWVICDRFTDSTLAYQGYGHGVTPHLIIGLHKLTMGDFKPDLTFIFDVDPDDGIKRAKEREAGKKEKGDRYERMGKIFHNNVRRGFLDIAKESPKRCVVINAADSIKNIHSVIITNINYRFDTNLLTLSEAEIKETL